MRILAITNIYPTGRTPTLGTYVEQQIQGLNRIGIETDLFLVDRSGGGVSAYVRLGPRVSQRVKELEPDLVHLMYGGVMADEVTRHVTDCPIIVSFCGSDLLGEELGKPLRKIFSSYGVLASRRAARRAEGVVVKSNNLFEALPPEVRASTKTRIIPNGIDLDRFRPMDREACRRQLGWDKNRFRVLFGSATGDRIKRPELARAVVNTLRESGLDCELSMLMNVPHHEVPIWLNGSDVLLVTSFREGSPNIVKEALSCNVPVVSVDVGDVRERLRGIEGCFVSPSDVSSLAETLRKVYQGPRRVAGRETVEKLSVTSVAIQLHDFYKEVLTFSGGPVRCS